MSKECAPCEDETLAIQDWSQVRLVVRTHHLSSTETLAATRQRERERDRERDRQTDRHRQRDRERETETEAGRENRERESYLGEER